MRFRRFIHATIRGVNPRRIKAAERALKRQRDKLPLFASEIASGQPTPEERISRMDENFLKYWQHLRDGHAETWRRARRNLRALPEEEGKMLLDRWNKAPYPADSAYFADMVHNWIRKNKPPEWIAEHCGVLTPSSEV